MMQGPTSWIVTLAVAYVALGALTLWAALGSRLPALIKALLIVAVSGFYVLAFFGLRALPGYAAEAPLPARFKLLSARVVEPKTIPGDPGSIYFWVEPMDENDVLSGAPRAFRIRYSEKEADNVVNALKRSFEGHPQQGRTGDAKDTSDWLGPNAGLAVDGTMSLNGREANADARFDDSIEFAPLPGPHLPAKDEQFMP
jgi:hypothetical protein